MKAPMLFAVGIVVSSLIGFFSTDLFAHTVPVHETMSIHALKRYDTIAGRCNTLTQAFRDEIRAGARQEDGKDVDTSPIPDPCRSRHHGYNPITGVTGGLFECEAAYTCLTQPGDPESARTRAIALWDTMLTQFAAGVRTGGDGVGAYHYLGRCTHLLQDVTSHPHVHPGEQGLVDACIEPSILPDEHKDYEDEEEAAFECQTCPTWLPPVDPPLYPSDGYPPLATDKLDSFSAGRLWSTTFSTDDVGDFIEAAARVTYFRSTFYGEVIFFDDTILPSSGEATNPNTQETTFIDGTIPAQTNVLRVMFGAANVRYVNSVGDDYFEITDADGNTHKWSNTPVIPEQWFPCDGETQDGHFMSSSDPVSEGARTTGRFHFANAYDGPLSNSDPVVPVNYPNGDPFDTGTYPNLGEYISRYAMGVGLRYNAGLIERGHAEDIEATATSGGSTSSNEVRDVHIFTQNLPGGKKANALNFISYNTDADIHGWCIVIDDFTRSTSLKTTPREIDARAYNTVINNGSMIKVSATHFLGVDNTMGFKNPQWEEDIRIAAPSGPQQVDIVPDHYWTVGFPEPIGAGLFRHRFTLVNDDPSDNLKVEGLQFFASMSYFGDLDAIVFVGPTADTTLAPAGSITRDVVTSGDFTGGHVYFKFDLYDAAGTTIVCNARADHPVASPGAGNIPVLSPLGIIALALLLALVGALLVRRRGAAAA